MDNPDIESPSGSQLESPWEDLVISILSVNQYSLEVSYQSRRGLEEQKLTLPSRLAEWSMDTIEERLRAAGYDRGKFMTRLFAQRLRAVGSLIKDRGVAECEKIICGHDVQSIEHLLLPVHGIGPVVLRNFYLLRGIANRSGRSPA